MKDESIPKKTNDECEVLHMSPQLFNNYKLLNHPDQLTEWITTGTTYPFLVNINLTNVCNNKCPRCTSRVKDRTTMSTEMARSILLQAKEMGARSIGLGGGGDPTCHPDLAALIRYAKELGLETAVTTNGYKLSDDLIEAIVDCCTWTRVSLDAADPEMYYKTHGMKGSAFNTVLKNIRKLAEKKKERNSTIVLGVTYLIDAYTVTGAYTAAKIVKEMGIDNIRFRPFFMWDDYARDDSASYENIIAELNRCLELSDESFLVSYPADRTDALTKGRERCYSVCFIHHFATIITPDCKVYPCCMLMDNEKYCYGDASKEPLKKIWDSPRRKEVYLSISLSDCPSPCMMEVHNELLWTIKTNKLGKFSLKDMINAMNSPIEHANWI
jgi:MoaA/NifB/PqqE/SkfB family radical SAM enzyme